METEQVTHEQTDTSTNETSSAETLVVVSKVKGYIRSRAGLNTSRDAIEALTQKVAAECEKAIERAKASGRKTVMGRDFE